MALVSLLLANVPSMEKRPQFDSLLLLLSGVLKQQTRQWPYVVCTLTSVLAMFN